MDLRSINKIVKINNFVSLIDGKLTTSPSISYFKNIIFDVDKVKISDIFIALNEEDVPLAISKGAFGIICEKECAVKDKDVAFIVVSSINDALSRYIRFVFKDIDVEVYHCDSITLDILDNMNIKKRVYIHKGDVAKEFYQILDIKKSKKMIFSDNMLSLRSMFFKDNVKEFDTEIKNEVSVLLQHPFHTSFLYKDESYKKFKVPSFKMKYIQKVLNFLDNKRVKYKLRPFTNLKHPQVVYLDHNLQIQEFGKFRKILIFEKYIDLAGEIKEYLKTLNWGVNIIYINPQDYNSTKSIYGILKNSKFDYALIEGVDKSILEDDLFTKNMHQKSLFN